MKSMLIALALFAGQATTMQEKPVVHLKPNTSAIEPAFGGSLLVLSNAPAVVHLPSSPPGAEANGAPWMVDVRNFGPTSVTIVDKQSFSTVVAVNQIVHILSNGRTYSLKH